MNQTHNPRYQAIRARLAALRLCATTVITLAVLVKLAGCQLPSERVMSSGAALPTSQLSREELRSVLNRFEDFFVTRVKQSASELDALMPSAKTQRVTLLWRTRCISALHTILEQDDPLTAFVDAWALSLRITLYFGSGEGNKLFEPNQEVALSAATEIEAEIERIARRFLEPDIFEQTQQDLRAFALANPIHGAFSKTLLYASEVKQGTPGPIETVVNLPLAPFRAIEGVDRGALAIRDFSMTAERFSDIVEELPESLRWQLLLWLYEFEESEMAKSVLASLERVAESSAKLTTTIETLPERMRGELSELIDNIDARQADMQTTLAQTRATTEALSELIEKTESTAQTLNVTSKNVTETAVAWQATMKAIDKTLERPETTRDPNTPRFSMANLNATANTVAVAAMEVRKLNEELMANANVWSTQTNRATTDIAWKLALLIGLTFALALAYRLLVTRLVPGQRR